jgi:hypothetical protein
MIRKTVTWMFLVVLLLGAAGGAYFYHYVTQSDELLLEKVREAVQRVAPDWNLTIARARFDFQGRIHLYDLKLHVDGLALPLCEVPEAIVVVDRDLIAEPNPPVQQIRFLRGQVRLSQDEAGEWNWRRLAPLSAPESAVPEIHAEQTTISIQSAGGGRESSGAPCVVQEAHLEMVPSGKRQFAIKLTGRLPHSEQGAISGQWQLDTGVWNLSGQARAVQIGPELIGLLRRFSAEFRAATDKYAGTVSADASRLPIREDGLLDLGITGLADAGFRIQQWHADAEPQYQLSVQLRQGELVHPQLPAPLREMRGTIECDEREIALKDFVAQLEAAAVQVPRARVYEKGELRPAEIDVAVQGLPLDDRIRVRLPEAIRRVYDAVQPSGRIDLQLRFQYNGRDYWEHDCDVIARNCTLMHRSFPYRVDGVEGMLKQRGDIIDVHLKGVAGERQVTLTGRVKNPGPEAASVFDIDTTGLPIDERLLNACPPGMRQAIETLQARGELDGRVRLVRPAGPDQRIILLVDGRVRNGTMLCRLFPYAVTGLTGRIIHDGTTWKVEGMRGQHESAPVTLSGTFLPTAAGTMLFDLSFTGDEIAFDERLYSALHQDWQTLWKELNPTGRFSVAGRLASGENGTRRIALEVDLIDAGLTIASFPFALDKMRGRLSLVDHELTIQNLSARHGDVLVEARGNGDCDPSGKWRLTLEDLEIDDLEPDRQFRKTLPAELRTIVDTLDPRGKLSLAGMVEFRGRARSNAPVTAAWDLETVYSGASMTVGIDLRDMHGTSRFRGTWDGAHVLGSGDLTLNSMRIRNYQFTDVRGPFHMTGKQLIVGSEAAVNGSAGNDTASSVNDSDRMTARFIDGKLALDALAALGDPLRYRVRLRFSRGELRKFAQLYLSGQSKLQGEMNGWVDLYGEGADPKRLTGKGELLISPAALYELPVIVAIFKVLSFVPPDKTMFDQALFSFAIQNETVQFGRIDLIGNAINLVGRGTVRFDCRVGLEFLSTIGRNQIPIPIVREALREVTKGWVGVQVSGTMKDPAALVRPVPQMDDALRRLLGIFDARQPPPPRR